MPYAVLGTGVSYVTLPRHLGILVAQQSVPLNHTKEKPVLFEVTSFVNCV